MLKKIAHNVSIAALFLVPLFPLIVANSYFFPFITGKAFFFRILVEAAFAGYLILCFLDAKYRPRLSSLTVAVTVFALITLAADLMGVNPLRSLWSNFERMEGWLVIAHLWAFFMVASGIFGSGEEGRRLWHRWINFELVVAAAVAVYGIFQILGWAAVHQGSTRIDASLGNAAYMAVYMLWNTGLAAYMFLVARATKAAKAGVMVWAYPIMAAVFAFEVFQTATRGTILGLVGGVMLACFLYAVLGKGQKKAHRVSAAAAIVVIVVLGVGLVAAKDASFVKDSEVLSRLASISWSEAQGQARNYIWPMAISGAFERPVLGWGQENFNYIFNANYNPKMWNQEQWFDRAHSVYLDWLVASGFVGLVAYLVLYVLLITAVWKQSPLTLAEKSILTGLVAGYAIHNAFVFDNLASYALFFAALAFVSSFRAGKPLPGRLGSGIVSAEAAEYVVAPAVIVALMAVLYFFNIRPIQANTALIDALQACANGQASAAVFEKSLAVDVYVANQEIREQLLSCASQAIVSQQVPGPTKQGLYDLALKSVNDQVAASPRQDARTYTLGGAFLDAIGQFDQAQPLLETALRLSPGKQSIVMELANNYLNSGDTAKSIELLDAAYLSATNNDRVNNAYALTLVLDGKEARAREIFGDNPAIFQTSQMAQAYMVAKQYEKGIAVYQALLASNPADANTALQLARAQYTAGQINASVATLQEAAKAFPEYKEQIDTAIKQIRGY